MLKSFLLFLLIGFITFWTTCGGTILILTRMVAIWWVLIIIGFISLYLFCRNFLWKYTWRFFIVSWLIGFIFFIVAWIVMQLIIWPIISWLMNARNIVNMMILLQFILPLFILFIHVMIFHFYRTKNQADTIQTGNIWKDIISMGRIILRLVTHLFGGSPTDSLNTIWLNESNIIEEKSTQVQENPIIPYESTQFMIGLEQVDISNVTSITFLPKNWQWFMIKTPNIKRLAIYITTKLGKTSFEAEELRGIYNYVVKNLQSNLSKTDYNIVQWKINEFVQSGGEVKIEEI